VVFILPYVFWAGFTEVFVGRFLWYFLVNRVHERLLPKMLQDRFLPHDYFRVGDSYPRHLWWRTLQLLFFVFFLSSIIVPRIPAISSSATNESAVFALAGLGYLLLLGPVL